MKEEQTVERAPERGEQALRPEAARPIRSRSRRLVVPLILLAAIAATAFLIWKLFFAKPGPPENVILLSGRIEGDDSALAPKAGGRIREIRFREGDHVKTGETIAVLDDKQIKAREDQARAALREAEAKAQSARDQIAVLQEQLRQGQLQTEQARVDAEGRVRQAQAELSAAEADLAQQEAAYKLALFDQEAYGRLARTGAVAERQGNEAASKAAQQAAVVAAACRRVEAARGALTTARANLANPGIRGAEAAAVRKQITRQEAEIASANASTEKATSGRRESGGDDRSKKKH
jgi:HlyD family secretion protein